MTAKYTTSEMIGIIKTNFICYEAWGVLLEGLRVRRQRIAERADLIFQADVRLDELDTIIYTMEAIRGEMDG